MNVVQGIVFSALLCYSMLSHAETNIESDQTDVDGSNIDKVDFLLSAGFTFGGDELASTTSGGKLKAGGMIYFAAGAMMHITPSFDFQMAYAYHFDELTADNGSAEFTRTALEFIPFFVTETGHRLGVGYTKIMSPEYTDPYFEVPFKDANGLIIEIDWPLGRSNYFGVRYVDVSYQDEYDILAPIDGSYLGLMVHGGF